MGRHAFDQLPEQAQHLQSNSPELINVGTMGIRQRWDMPLALWRAEQDVDVGYPDNRHRTLSFVVGGGWIERLDGRYRGRRGGQERDRFILYPGGGSRSYAYGAGVRVCQIYFGSGLLSALAADDGRDGPVRTELRDDRVFAADTQLLRLADEYLGRALDTVEPPSTLEMDARAVLLGLHLLRRHGSRSVPERGRSGALDRRRVRTAMDHIDAHLHGKVSLAAIAASVQLTPQHFCTAFRLAVGVTPHAYLNRRRIDLAKSLLIGPMPLIDIALACGFASQQHFTTAFTRSVGVPPGTYRRARRG